MSWERSTEFNSDVDCGGWFVVVSFAGGFAGSNEEGSAGGCAEGWRADRGAGSIRKTRDGLIGVCDMNVDAALFEGAKRLFPAILRLSPFAYQSSEEKERN